MGHVAEGLVVLGCAFLVCGVVARVGVPVGLPTIPLFVVAGIVLGPHTPGLDLVRDPDDLALVARLGLVFLLFFLGLEFSFGQLLRGGRRMVVAAAVYLVLNVGGGVAFGAWLDWGAAEAFVVAGIVAISSTAIATKLLIDTRRFGNPETRVILGIIVIEDLFLAGYLALLQPVLGGAGTLVEAVLGIGTSLLFLAALVVVTRYGTPLVERLFDTADDEIVVVLFAGLAIVVAGMAEQLGVSDAIGAFMVGLILGASSRAARLKDLAAPLRDAFAAIFFFHFGLSIDPAAVWEVAGAVGGAAAMTVVLALAAGSVAARLHRFGRQEAANIGLTVLARGEFSLVLASLALAAGLDARIGSLAAGYVLVLAVLGPAAALASRQVASLLPRRLFSPEAVRPGPDLDLEPGSGWLYDLGTEMLQVRVVPGSRLQGVTIGELRLPTGSTPGMLLRAGRARALGPGTQLRIGDVLLLLTEPSERPVAERRLRAVHRRGRLATWLGETGE